MSTSGDRCAYLDGSAYLLGIRFFFGLADDSGELLTSAVAVVLPRFLDFVGDADNGGLSCTVRVSVYWYLFNLFLKDAEGGVASLSPTSVTSSLPWTAGGASVCSTCNLLERVRAIFGLQVVS
jgi:hypothetical protein